MVCTSALIAPFLQSTKDIPLHISERIAVFE